MRPHTRRTVVLSALAVCATAAIAAPHPAVLGRQVSARGAQAAQAAQSRRRPDALVQRQHAHAHHQQRRRQHAGRSRQLVPHARLSVPGADRSQLPHQRRRAERAPRRRRAVPRRPGEEVTSRAGDKPVHVNGLDVQRLVEAHEGATVLERCSATSTASAARPACRTSTIRTSAGASRGRPATGAQLQAVRDLQRASERQQPGRRRSARPGGGVGSLLSSGTIVYGVAVDDAHTFKDPGNPRWPVPGAGG